MAVVEETAKPKPVEVFRKDYKPLPFTIREVELDFDIHDGKTLVTSVMIFQKNPKAINSNGDHDNNKVILDGDQSCVTLISVALNKKPLVVSTDYVLLADDKMELIVPIQDGDTLQTVVEIVPETNTQLMGLYKSGESMYCTQCEAMGFRRITYFLDRPDNMSTFRKVRLEANQESYPVLLSNGNCIEKGSSTATTATAAGRRHYVIWSDPFPKPSYLFAAVVGNLGSIKDTYVTTPSNKTVQLEIFSEHDNVHKLQHAMNSLKAAMSWDEKRFQLEYDLGVYNIVATNDFNMGAMENKSLNIFNTSCVLANQKTATDADFERIEGIIGHEYFHNWTGNRVTCLDWFQLTLKEGLTVFRDQEFSGDLNSRAVKRIEDVKILRAHQFAEDAGPMSHPIRPESYVAMDNFYTATVYDKGAEIIRMYQTILTPAGFNKGMKLYFERHDGQAVTCDDFLMAMGDANNVDLKSQFALWYCTPGTPVVKYSRSYDETKGVFSLTLSQTSQSKNGPLYIPIAIGLIDRKTGEEVVPTKVLHLKEETQTFTFENLKGNVIPSLLRDFSAPIKLLPETGDVNEDDLAFLAANDTDGFNRWESGQKLYTSLIFQIMNDGEASSKTMDHVNEAFGRALADTTTTDYSIQAYTLLLPTESTLAEEIDDDAKVDPIGIYKARKTAKKALARKFQTELLQRYNQLTETMAGKEFSVDATSIGRRRLRNVMLTYLCSLVDTPEEEETAAKLAMDHFENATGMTDKMAAFSALASMSGKGAESRDKAVQMFYDEAEGDALVVNKWFRTQALADLPDIMDRIRKLTEHKDFTLTNPNRARSLVLVFTMNAPAFHAEDGSGYQFVADMIQKADPINPRVSARLAGKLITWKRFDETRGRQMKAQLEKLAAMKLSDDLYEIVNRGLKE